MKNRIFIGGLLGMAMLFIVSCTGNSKKIVDTMPSDSLKTAVATALDTYVSSLMTSMPDTAAIFPTLQSFLDANPAVYGSAFALEPVIQGSDTIRYAPYMYRTKDGFITKYLEKAYDYSKDDWYAVPVKTKNGFWSEPYFDAGGGEVQMITYSKPLIFNDSLVVGVITADLEIK